MDFSAILAATGAEHPSVVQIRSFPEFPAFATLSWSVLGFPLAPHDVDMNPKDRVRAAPIFAHFPTL